jgi:eukaryotic-like serine/threonine-protein kinase
LRPDRDTNEQSLNWPRFLPDGQSFLYVRVSGRRELNALMVSTLDRPEPVVLTGIASSAVLAEPGMLLYVRNGWIVAQPFDTTRRTLHGEPTLLAGPVEVYDSLGASFDARSIDRVIYRPLLSTSALQLAWHARDGRLLEEIGRPEIGLSAVTLSRDGTQLVGQRLVEQNDLWLWDLVRGSQTRLTMTDSWETGMALSPDGRQVAFGSDERGTMDLYSSSIARPGDRRLLASLPDSALWPSDWSSDGRVIVGTGIGPQTQQDVWMYSMDTRSVTWLFRTPAREGSPRISPNGRWLAYQSDEAGQFDVYIATLPLSSDRWKISNGGGSQPHWRADGRELFFIGRAGDIYAVKLDEREHRLTPHPPSRLFNVPGWNAFDKWGSRYGVSPDGQRFLIARDVNSPTIDAYGMISGWRPPVTPP